MFRGGVMTLIQPFETHFATLTCACCGQPAATFTLLPAGTGEGMWRERDRLERTGFLGTTARFDALPALAALMQAIQQRDHAVIRGQVGPDLVAFHCWQCGVDYCQDCWRIGPPEFDEDFPGFYDCTHGVCPAGHEQIVDD
jgi:hypothetical protein